MGIVTRPPGTLTAQGFKLAGVGMTQPLDAFTRQLAAQGQNNRAILQGIRQLADQGDGLRTPGTESDRVVVVALGPQDERACSRMPAVENAAQLIAFAKKTV